MGLSRGPVAPDVGQGRPAARGRRRRGPDRGRPGKLRAVLRQRSASEGRDPLAELAAREADPDEPDFDVEAELEALERDHGIVRPLPIVTRAEAVARLVRAVGWEGARELGRGTWSGWEVDFLRAALVVLAEAEKGDTMLNQAALLRGVFGGGFANDGP